MKFDKRKLGPLLSSILRKKTTPKARKKNYPGVQPEVIFRATLEGRWLTRWEHVANGTKFTAPVQQFQAIHGRKFRFDFAFPDQKILVEVQGGICARGRMGHSSITGHERDAEKLNMASAAGYRTFHFTTKMIEDERGFDLLLRALEGK